MSKLVVQVNPILIKLKNGDSSAFKELFDATYEHLKGIAEEYVLDKNDIEDIIQDAYMRVLKYIDSFDSKRDGYNWLCKIVQNEAYDFYRNAPPIRLLSEISFNLEESIVDRHDVNAELAKLPKDDQVIMYLRFWKDKTIREIAKEVGLARSAVQKHIEDIKKIFEKNLK